MSELRHAIDEAVQRIHAECELAPKVAVILGTGLNNLAERIETEARISNERLPHFAVSTVESHAGELVLGYLGGKPLVAMSGRFHRYEGYSLKEVTFPVRVMRALGAEVLVAFNAAGGLNPQFRAGDVMVIEDHINLMGDNPLIGPNDDTLGPRFPDMTEAYSPRLIALAEEAAAELGTSLRRGVYAGLSGPCYETAAEIRYLERIGADAVGMSTVPEVIVARYFGMEVLGISCVTNMATGIATVKHAHAEVVRIANEASTRFCALVATTIGKIGVV